MIKFVKTLIVKLFTIFIVMTLHQTVYGEIQKELQKGFVYLQDIDPTIKQNIIYATSNNFMGEPAPGYNKPIAILTKEAAIALKKTQAALKSHGYSLVVFDAYRPTRAVKFFSTLPEKKSLIEKLKNTYFPRVKPEDLFELGYIARKSAHSRGSTVDVSLIKLDNEFWVKPRVRPRTLADGTKLNYLDYNLEDFGVHVDFADDASHHGSLLVNEQQQEMREFLKKHMTENGFKPISTEYWHYRLADEPYPDEYFDFSID